MEVVISVGLLLWMIRWAVERAALRKVAYTVHIQGRTEQDETMDFAVTLLQDETPEERQAKIDGAFEMREARLKFQNDRVLKIMAESKLKTVKEA